MGTEPEQIIAMFWNEDEQSWCCAHCGGSIFRQIVIAENFVTITSGDATTLVESEDFDGTWEVTDRGPLICVECEMKIEWPEGVEVME